MMKRFAAVLILTCATGVAAQRPAQPALSFDVASVKPNTGQDLSIPFDPHPSDGAILINHPLELIVRYAYDVQPYAVAGVPRWASEERFDVIAKAVRPITDAERRQMMRAVLEERFRFRGRFESREQTIHVLRRLAGVPLGSGLKPRAECGGDTNTCSPGGGNPSAGSIALSAVTLDQFASGMLTAFTGSVVRDKTNTRGVFDVRLSWRPDGAERR